ncbi:MAG: serine O-acetyltransferase [Myxococcales bacterium]|nr:serine O-acetyltransferase [Myxococcales bacterium]
MLSTDKKADISQLWRTLEEELPAFHGGDAVMKTSHRAQQHLEQIADAVTASYQLGRPIDSLESTALPNTRKVVEALGELVHVIYMGFFSTRVLSPINLRQHVGEHLYRAAEILIEQIARAVVYERRGGGAPGHDELDWSERAVMDVFTQIPRLREQLTLDVQAAFSGDPAAKSIEEVIFSYPGVQAITVYRLAHEFYKLQVPMVPRIMAEHSHGRTGIEIHPGAHIGRSFFIDHGTGVVIGETTVIGDNVKLYQGVTLGALSVARDAAGEVIRELKRHPTIEDDVTIYAGATILGGDTVIGRGAVIGANTWITQSVAANTRVTYAASGSDGNGRQHYDTSSPPEG